MDANTAVGITGVAMMLTAYMFNQIGKWSAKSYMFDLINFMGSGVLLIYAFLIKSVPFMILNGVWMVVALRDVANSLSSKS